VRVCIYGLELFVASKQNCALFFQLSKSFKTRGLLRFVHDRPDFHFRISRIAHFHRTQFRDCRIPERFQMSSRNEHAAYRRALLP